VYEIEVSRRAQFGIRRSACFICRNGRLGNACASRFSHAGQGAARNVLQAVRDAQQLARAALPLPSCNPPVRTSDLLTNRNVGSASGFIKLRVFCVAPETVPPCTPGDGQEEEDIALDSFGSDVQCRIAGPSCSGPGADYTGGLLGVSTIRITDHSGGAPALACANPTGAPPCTPVTAINTDFAVPTNGLVDASPCVATGGAAGSNCNFTSTINAQVPGAVKEQQAGTVSIFGLQVKDLGPDGTLGGGCPPVCGTGDEKTFVEQGIFLP